MTHQTAVDRTESAEAAAGQLRRIIYTQIAMISAAVDPAGTEAADIAHYQERLHSLMHTLRQCRETAAEEADLGEGAAHNAAAALAETEEISRKAGSMLGELTKRQRLAAFAIVSKAGQPDRSATSEAQRLYLSAEDSATTAAHAANLAESYSRAAQLETDEMKKEIRDAYRENAAQRLAMLRRGVHIDTSRAIESTEAAALSAIQAAYIARNHPDNPDVAAAAVMALGALIEAAKRTQRTLTAGRLAHQEAPTAAQPVSPA